LEDPLARCGEWSVGSGGRARVDDRAEDADSVDPSWQHERAEAPLKGRVRVGVLAEVGVLAGRERLGGTLYAIDPATAARRTTSPRQRGVDHRDCGPSVLRTLAGVSEVWPGGIVACPTGPRGSRQIQNCTTGPVRVLVVSTMVCPDVVELPIATWCP
jgi:hypothetical protein